jgi:hypothetical protein
MHWLARLAATGGAALALAAASPPKMVFDFIEDDAPRALAEAQARNRPLFVEYWAPW